MPSTPTVVFFFFSSRRRHTRLVSDWTDVCSSDLRFPSKRHPVSVISKSSSMRIPPKSRRSEERRVKSVDLGGRRIIKKKKKEKGQSEGEKIKKRRHARRRRQGEGREK